MKLVRADQKNAHEHLHNTHWTKTDKRSIHQKQQVRTGASKQAHLRNQRSPVSSKGKRGHSHWAGAHNNHHTRLLLNFANTSLPSYSTVGLERSETHTNTGTLEAGQDTLTSLPSRVERWTSHGPQSRRRKRIADSTGAHRTRRSTSYMPGEAMDKGRRGGRRVPKQNKQWSRQRSVLATPIRIDSIHWINSLATRAQTC